MGFPGLKFIIFLLLDPGDSSSGFTLLLIDFSLLGVSLGLLLGIFTSLESSSVLVLGVDDTINDDNLSSRVDSLIFIKVSEDLIEQPGGDLLSESPSGGLDKDALSGKVRESQLPQATKVALGNLLSIKFLMGSLSLLLSGFVLPVPSLSLFLASLFSGLVPLGDDELGVDSLLVLLLLPLDGVDLELLLDLHLGLLECLLAEDVEHRLDLSIEVKQTRVTFIDLSLLAVSRLGHLGVEHGNWRPVHVELSGVTGLLLWRLIGEDLLVLHGLDVHVAPTRDRFRGWNVSVGINILFLF